MSIRKYPKYKESGSAWMGQVPAHWNVTQGRRLFAQKRDPARVGDEQLSATQAYGVLPQRMFMELEDQKLALAHGGLGSFKQVQENDFVISLRSFQGGIEHSTYSGCVSPAYTVLRPSASEHGRFWAYLLKSSGFIAELQSVTDGIREGKNVSYEQFGQILLPKTPVSEQIAIASFLDGETSKIDALVSEQRRLVDLLKEKRQAVITKVVTKGLDGHTDMKASGIEWLDEVPETWDAVSLKRLARVGRKTFTDGDWIESPFIAEEGVRLIQTGNVGIGSFKEQGFRYVSETTVLELHCTEVNPGDVLICRLDGPVGRACVAPDLGVRMITSVDNTILKVENNVSAAFVVALLSSVPWLSWIDALCRVGGGFRLRISRSMLGDLRVPLPHLTEQRDIVAYLTRATAEWDALTTEAERAIHLLQERREALVSATVTGKIDVRALVGVEEE